MDFQDHPFRISLNFSRELLNFCVSFDLSVGCFFFNLNKQYSGMRAGGLAEWGEGGR